MAIHFRQATSVFMQTLPFVALRMAVGVAFALLMVLYFAIVAGVLWLVGASISGAVVVIVVLLTVGIFLATLRLVRRYVLYLVAAGHIAVIAQIVETGEKPENQLSFGKERVTSHFKEASALFVVDQVVKTVINQFNRTVITLTNLLNFVPALRQIVEIIRRAISIAGNHLDEAILAYIFLEEHESNWTAARDGLVLYAKCWKPVLTAALILVVAMYVILAVLALLLAPLAIVLGELSPTTEVIGWVVVLGLLALLHFGLVAPYIKTVIITTFLVESRDLTPDSATMDMLEKRASAFREIITNAAEEEAGEPVPESPEPTEGGEGAPG